jgi:predicted short-subunit dehydrogenase-like oxidoreductase (DUF2520 family)
MALGPGLALTGPAARGDWETIARHRAVLATMADGRAELEAYDTMVGLARRLVEDPGPVLAAPDAVKDAA